MHVGSRLRIVLLVALAGLAAAGCGKQEAVPAAAAPAPPVAVVAPVVTAAAAPAKVPEAAAAAAPAPHPAAAEADPAAPAAVDPTATGQLRVVFEPSKSTKSAPLAAKLRDAAAFTGLVKGLNAHLRLPRDLPIRFADCSAEQEDQGAYYDEETRAILVCWSEVREMADGFVRDAKADHEDPKEAEASLVGATLFTVLHEIAHALVHVLDLPITGREEDAADQLATWLLVSDADHAGADMAIDGALSFLHDAGAEDKDGEDPATWDEHSLSEQRFYNIVCWVYGSQPDAFGDLLESKDGPLPDDRAEVCPDEWKKLASAWPRLLEDHLRR